MTVPNVGRPVTVMVKVSPSTSVGVVSPRDVFDLASSTVMLLLSATESSLTAVTLMVMVLAV